MSLLGRTEEATMAVDAVELVEQDLCTQIDKIESTIQPSAGSLAIYGIMYLRDP